MDEACTTVDDGPTEVLEVLSHLRKPVPKKVQNASESEYLDRERAAEYIGLSSFWLQKHAQNPDAPQYVIHGRKAWYRRQDLDAWLTRRSNAQNLPSAMGRNHPRGNDVPDKQVLDRLFEEHHGLTSRESFVSPAGEETPLEVMRLAGELYESLTPEQKAVLSRLIKVTRK